ncbi:MAG: hypothetical protein GX765_03715 [Candidatus Moranbacteria bacterium]|nr:hypothetical protein [Candidatus Moranbacteria bacterium]
MKKTVKKIGVLFLVWSFVFTPVSFQFDNLSINKEVGAANLENINIGDIREDIVINENENFIVESSGEIIFTQDYITIDVYGRLEIKGTQSNPVKIKTIKSNFAIITHPGSEVIIDNVEIEKGGYQSFLMNNFFSSAIAANYMGAVHFEGGNVNIKGTTFKNCSNAVTSEEGVAGELKVNYSKFINNEYDVEDENGSDFTNNYWDDLNSSETCQNNKNVSSCLSNSWGNFKIDPWQTDPNFSYEEGASSVLFLPGIKASHLYKYDNDGDEDELWVPNWFGDDIEELKLNSNGKSINDVFVKNGGILETTIKGDIYNSFIDDLKKMKAENTISDYNAFAYDWRQSVEDIVENGTPYENNQIKQVLSEIDTLAQTSKSGKVTIVAHSNGGLVAKMIVKEIKDRGLENKVDKIILVGTPQMGTPIAILSFLYGYEESLPTLLSQEDARELIENMPGAYGLLPSREYLSRLEDDEEIVEFSAPNTERGKKFIEIYGNNIDSFEEFRNFLLGDADRRLKPEKDEIELENKLNTKLLDEAIAIHSELDNFSWPEEVKIIQIAGWGLDTIKGIEYKEKHKIKCITPSYPTSFPSCYESGEYELIPEPTFTIEGDKIVIVPSALMLNDGVNTERYWINLSELSKKVHGNIFEVDNIREFIENQIKNKETDLPKYMSDKKPEITEGISPRIRMRLYSPLDIHVCDKLDNCVGYGEIETAEGAQKIINEDLNNSYYFQLGERKYLGFDEDNGEVEIRLDGYGEGSYTLEIEEVEITNEGENITNFITYKNLPTSDKTKVSLTIPEGGLADISDLEADYDGDGGKNYVIESRVNQENVMPDMIAPQIEIISPESRVYEKDETMAVSLNISDNVSDLENIKVNKILNGEKLTKDVVDLSLLRTGQHIFAIEATDEAGNQAREQVKFELSTDIKTLQKNLDHFYDLGLIRSSQEKKMINNKLELIQRELEFYYSIKNNIFIKNKTKKRILGVLKKTIQIHLDILSNKIEQDKKSYATMIKEVIIDDINFIKNNF